MSECLPGCPCGENPEPKNILIVDDDAAMSEEIIKSLAGNQSTDPSLNAPSLRSDNIETPASEVKRQARLQRLRGRRRGRVLRHGETE